MNYSPSFILCIIALISACCSFIWPVMLNVSVILISIAVLIASLKV